MLPVVPITPQQWEKTILPFPRVSKQLRNGLHWLKIKVGALDPPLDVWPLHMYSSLLLFGGAVE